MGIVYLADDTRLNRKVAVKALHSHLVADAKQRERFPAGSQGRGIAFASRPWPRSMRSRNWTATSTSFSELRSRRNACGNPGTREIFPKRRASNSRAGRRGTGPRARQGDHSPRPQASQKRDPYASATGKDHRLRTCPYPRLRFDRAALDSNGAVDGVSRVHVSGTTAGRDRGLSIGTFFAFGILLYELLSGTHPFQDRTAACDGRLRFYGTNLPPSPGSTGRSKAIVPALPPERAW